MKQVFDFLLPLLFGAVLLGCSPRTSGFASTNENLRSDYLSQISSGEIVIPDDAGSEEDLSLEDWEPLLLPEESPSVVLCVCEWSAWETSQGLLCLGVVCSLSCPPEVSECRERRQVCLPR